MRSTGEPVGLLAPFTAIPNILIDEVMPTLKDTEWRLLCVIARQTLGWVEKNGKRKQRDWMSQSQLITKTGRNSAALSAALDVLVRENLIECQAESGESLRTPEQRRKHRGRVYFSLTLERIEPTKSELQKANRTKKEKTKETLYIWKKGIPSSIAVGLQPTTSPKAVLTNRSKRVRCNLRVALRQ